VPDQFTPDPISETRNDRSSSSQISRLNSPVKRWLHRHRVELFLFLLLWSTYAYFYQSTQDNEAARLDQTRAIVQDGTLLINKYWWNSADVIHYAKDGTDHIYPAKAPGMSFVAVIPFAVFSVLLNFFRAVGLPEWIYWHLVTYLTIVFTVNLLSALTAVATYRVLKRVTADSYFSVFIVLAIWLGSLAFPFSTVFFSHQLTAALLAIAFYLLFKVRWETSLSRLTVLECLLAGFLMGFSVTTEYPTALLAALLGLYTLWSARRWMIPSKSKWILLIAWALGGAIGGGALVAYNLAAFGKPLYLAYEALSRPGSPFPTHSHGWIGFQWPGLSHFLHAVASFMIFPPVGLLYLTVENWRVYACNPVLWLALPGLVIMIWQRAWRAEGLLIAAMTVVYLLFIACYGTSIYDWAGASYLGPRHIIPLLPFLALPLYFGARKLRLVFYPLLVVSVFYMLLATAIEPRVPNPFENPQRDFLLPDYLRGKLAENPASMYDPEHRNLTVDSTAFNPPKLAGVPGRYQLAPLMLSWLIIGGTLLFLAAGEDPLAEERTAAKNEGRSVSGLGGEPPSRRPESSPKAAVNILFLFVAAVTVAPIIHHAAASARDTRHGLLAKYFRNDRWAGEPVDVQVDPAVNFDWSKSFPLPAPFSVEWTGEIVVDQPGDYAFFLIADDGALLEIDGKMVVDVTHGPILQERAGAINLSAGLHPIRVRYLNTLFGGSVKLSWTLTGRPKEIVPSEVLLPERTPSAQDHR